jgi:magnesium chelatase subunit D
LLERAVSDSARRAGDALLAAACLALEPMALGGIDVRTDRGLSCERWLQRLQELLGDQVALRRMPPHIDDERLLGGTDLAATLATGRAVPLRGLLSEAAGSLILASLAERIAPRLAGLVGAAIDAGSIGVVALDSGRAADEHCPAALTERLSMRIDLNGIDPDDLSCALVEPAMLEGARARLGSVAVDAAQVQSLCVAAAAFGIPSLRAPLLALRVARAIAALDGRVCTDESDLEAAARLVLAPRARTLPAPPPDESAAEQSEPPERDPAEQAGAEDSQPVDDTRQDDTLVEATRAAIPADLLSSLAQAKALPKGGHGAGRMGAALLTRRRGRPIGVRAGSPRQGARLNILATLRVAAPWQRLRRLQAPAGASLPRVLVRAEDFRITRYRERSETATVFVLDASGSSAMHRLAECKGAVELLLAECYVRRDQVAVVSFRGRRAELIVPPTRSLVRAKRSLAGLPGGGATPLAHGLDLTADLAEQLQRRGLTPLLVLLTDGNANIARDGSSGRARAEQDAQLAARRLRAGGFRSLLIDTAPRPQPSARALSAALQARYLPLPYADARTLLSAVSEAA